MKAAIIGLAAMAAAAGLSACAPPSGARAPGLATNAPLGGAISENYLQIVQADQNIVAVDSNGRIVRAPAPRGYCIPIDGVLTGPASVFFIMERCRPDATGLLSVSIAKQPLFAGAPPTPERYRTLAAFLQSDEGRGALGFDAGSGAIFVDEASYEEGALFVSVRDGSGAGPDFAGRLMCRAFTELNGRMTVITLLSMKMEQADRAELKARLKEVVRVLRGANGEAPSS